MIDPKVKNVVIGEMYILWEFEETDVPMLYNDPGVISFKFKELDKHTELHIFHSKVYEIFVQIAKKKKSMKELGSIINAETATPLSSAVENLSLEETNAKQATKTSVCVNIHHAH